MDSAVRFSILSLIVLYLPTLVRWAYDTYHIKVKKLPIGKTGYLWRNILTGSGILAVALLDTLLTPGVKYHWAVLFSYIMFIATFDYMLNLSRGKNFFYVSPNPNHPSLYERLRQALRDRSYIIGELFTKLWLLGVGIGCYYYYNYL